jgi:hypothetical protein
VLYVLFVLDTLLLLLGWLVFDQTLQPVAPAAQPLFPDDLLAASLGQGTPVWAIVVASSYPGSFSPICVCDGRARLP